MDAEREEGRTKGFRSGIRERVRFRQADVEKMMKNLVDPSDIGRVHDYLSERRRRVAAVYKYSYSDLLSVFAILFRDGWLGESDLTGLKQDKIDRVKLWAEH